MYIVEEPKHEVMTADSPKQAVQKVIEKGKTNVIRHFHIWDVNHNSFFVMAQDPNHNADKPELEQILHFDAEKRTKLINSMMHHAQHDADTLKQICSMASLCIDTQESYNDWVGVSDEKYKAGS